MRTGYTAAQIREAEQPLLQRGVPLMLRAAQALADQITSVLPDPATARVLFLAGGGDNGADATYAASLLAAADVRAEVIAVAGKLHPQAEEAARDAGAEIMFEQDPAAVAARVTGADVLVDGVLGIGTGGGRSRRITGATRAGAFGDRRGEGGHRRGRPTRDGGRHSLGHRPRRRQGARPGCGAARAHDHNLHRHEGGAAARPGEVIRGQSLARANRRDAGVASRDAGDAAAVVRGDTDGKPLMSLGRSRIWTTERYRSD